MAVSRLKVGLIVVLLVCCIVGVLVFVSLNSRPVQNNVVPSRLDSIPAGAVKVAPDADVFPPVLHSDLWFEPVPLGTGVNLFTAEYKDGKWSDWQYARDRLNMDYQVGEMCLTPDGSEMYFHSSRAGGLGGLDVWVTRKIGGEWQTTENVAAVNTLGDEGWPYVTEDGKELWFTRTYLGSLAVYRSVKANGTWSEPELIISQFASEPSVVGDGNIYFVHHFYTADSRMIEADIYVARRK